MNQKILPLAVVVVAVLVLAAAAASGAFNAATVPNVKFVSFDKEGMQTITSTKSLPITFKVHNYENSVISNATIVTKAKSDKGYLLVDKPQFAMTPPLDAGGESGPRTVTVTGANLGDLSSIDDAIIVQLYVGSKLSDTREIAVHFQQEQ